MAVVKVRTLVVILFSVLIGSTTFSLTLITGQTYFASAAGNGEPEIERVFFIDRYRPTHLAGPSDPGVCDNTSNNFKTIAGGIKWKNFPVAYNIDASNVVGVSAADAKNAVKAAFKTWDDEDHPNGTFFKEVQNSNDAKIKVRWDSIDGQGATLAYAITSYIPPKKEITSAEIVFDSNDLWRTFGSITCGPQGSDPTLEFDVEDVAAHEIGHTIGFDHVGGGSDTYNTLYTYIIFEGETHKRTLGDGERIGIATVYGSSGGGACPPKKPGC